MSRGNSAGGLQQQVSIRTAPDLLKMKPARYQHDVEEDGRVTIILPKVPAGAPVRSVLFGKTTPKIRRIHDSWMANNSNSCVSNSTNTALGTAIFKVLRYLTSKVFNKHLCGLISHLWNLCWKWCNSIILSFGLFCVFSVLCFSKWSSRAKGCVWIGPYIMQYTMQQRNIFLFSC